MRLFTKAVAMECAGARDNVRVNSIHPGLIETPLWNAIIPGAAGGRDAPNLDAISEQGVPTGKKGLPEDNAAGVLFLASDESRYMTGSELVIAGGLSFCCSRLFFFDRRSVLDRWSITASFASAVLLGASS